MSSSTEWTIMGGRVLRPAPFLIAGIINATPDSFYDGGKCKNAESAIARGVSLVREGAHILDVGGESSRPFADPVTLEDELDRVIPVVRGLVSRVEVPVSVDTYKAETARQGLEAGASIINDISACRFDPDLKDVLVHYKPGYVLMHSLGRPREMQLRPSYSNVVDEVFGFLEDAMKELVKTGLPEDRIVLDPGIGFGKSLEHNLTLLANVEKFQTLGRPVYLGLSNKSMWEKLLGLPLESRKAASQVATALTAMKGAVIHRVHEVERTRQSLTIVQALSERQNLN